MSFFDECAGNLEQQNAYRMIANTNNSFFLTGKAGTGKSTFLKRVCEVVKKSFVVLAPTGVAAYNIGGQTIHSFFGLSFGVQGPHDYGRINESRIKLIERIDTIIIDEISMVRCDMVDVMDRMLRRHRNSAQPFGGVQMVFVGDLFQLPPVITSTDRAMLRRCYDSSGYYFYDSNVLKGMKLPKIEFIKVYRQTDPAFIELLDRVRIGNVLSSDIRTLNTRVIDEEMSEIDDSFRITLTTRKNDAALINENRLAKIDSKEFTYRAIHTGDCSKAKDLAEEVLTLKVGAQVMFIRNDRENGWINGTIGKVSQLDENKIVVALEDGKEREVETCKWEIIDYAYDEQSKTVKKTVIGKVTQYPLRLAWAMTIHKSQSLTFDKVAINMGAGAFTFGQTYVALSRARTFKGIDLLQHIGLNSITVSREILDFASEFNDEKVISTELEIGEAISKYEKSKDYDGLAVTLCQMAHRAIENDDIYHAYYLMSRALLNIVDDDCLFDIISWNTVSDDTREGIFLNAVKSLYSRSYADAEAILEMYLKHNPENFNAIYLLSRVYEKQGQIEKMKDCMNDMAAIISKAVDNGLASSSFRKYHYRKSLLYSSIYGNPDGIQILRHLIQENPGYDKYHIAIRDILRKYKTNLETEISDSNIIIKTILDDEASESDFLDILHDIRQKRGNEWNLYRRSLRELEFGLTDDEVARLEDEIEELIKAGNIE